MRRRACRSQCAQPSCNVGGGEQHRGSAAATAIRKQRNGPPAGSENAPAPLVPAVEEQPAQAPVQQEPIQAATCLAQQLRPQLQHVFGSRLILRAGHLHKQRGVRLVRVCVCMCVRDGCHRLQAVELAPQTSAAPARVRLAAANVNHPRHRS